MGHYLNFSHCSGPYNFGHHGVVDRIMELANKNRITYVWDISHLCVGH